MVGNCENALLQVTRCISGVRPETLPPSAASASMHQTANEQS